MPVISLDEQRTVRLFFTKPTVIFRVTSIFKLEKFLVFRIMHMLKLIF